MLGLGTMQVGIIVKDMNSALDKYSKSFNIKNWMKGNFIEEEYIYKGKSIKIDFTMAYSIRKRLMIELLEVKKGDENVFSHFLDEHGEGIHHLGYYVRNFEKEIEKYKTMGIDVIQHGCIKSLKGSITRIAILDTEALYGYAIELLETRILGIPIGQSAFILYIMARLTGDVERIKL
ncbi:MAG: VOC family protein [Lentisphaerae bacterium]|nr:VOC family protein [Lentisphaerota bacterium]